MAFQPLNFQIAGIEFIKSRRYCILGYSPGMGKSATAIEASFQMKAQRILVICPAYLVLNWKKEIKKFWPEKSVVAFTDRKYICTPFDVDVAILSYSLLSDSECLFEWSQIVIADEAQYLKNMKSNRGDLFHSKIYENSIPRVILLSGTLAENRVYELHSPLTIMHYNPKETDVSFLTEFPTYVEFANEFSYLHEYTIEVNGRRQKIKNWKGLKNKERLKKILDKFMLVEKFDDHIKLDKPIIVPVYTNETDDEELLTDFNKFIESNGDRINSTAKAKSALSKVKLTAEYVKTTLQGERVVIFSDHVEAANALGGILNCPVVTGQMSVPKRQELADRFNNKEIDVLVATIGSFSTGINLHENCNQLVVNDYPWKPSSMVQVFGRIRRVGQSKQCIYHTIFSSPQDEKIYKTILEKEETLKQLI